MVFSGIPFLYFFLTGTILLYAVTPRKLKNAVLLISDIIFYAWGERMLALVFIASMLAGWGAGLLIEKFRGKKKLSGLFLGVSVVLNLGMLCYFKYTDFFIENLNAAFGLSVPFLKVALPIGISFYTFQIISYEADVYRGTVNAQRNPVNFSLYVSLFPQLIAGPVVRYSDIEWQLTGRTHTIEKISSGIRRFVTGLGKKVLIANVLGEICALYRGTENSSVLFCWLYAAAYILEIYFDFSGYSDMAIGLAKMFGFELTENFNYPYISGSITEFWRRWHISLGSWFRDYVYIPLGGNRCSKIKHIRNIFVVWLLTGLWHGAAWNFVLWGLFYGVLLFAEKMWLGKFFDKHRAIGHIFVFLATVFGFVLFGAADMAEFAGDIAGLSGLGGLPFSTPEAVYYLRSYGFIILLGIIGCTPLPKLVMQKLESQRYSAAVLQIAEPVLLTGLLMLVTAYLADGSFNPFMYFRF